MIQGRVLREAIGGLPGAGLEGVWITLHSVEIGRPLVAGALPPAIGEAQTGPQGEFVLARAPVEEGRELVIAVSPSRGDQPVLIRPLADAGALTLLLAAEAASP